MKKIQFKWSLHEINDSEDLMESSIANCFSLKFTSSKKRHKSVCYRSKHSDVDVYKVFAGSFQTFSFSCNMILSDFLVAYIRSACLGP